MGNPEYIFINGKINRADLPLIKAEARGLMYGDGCFETLCSYNGCLLKPEEHLKRLKRGLNYLEIDYPVDLESQNIEKILARLLNENELMNQNAIIRMQVWREGERGYGSDSTESSYMLTAVNHNGAGKKYNLSCVPIRRIPSAALPSEFKFTNGINYIKAANYARSKGADDALMQTLEGWVSETTVANIFWKKDNTVFTPSAECDILPGITRQMVMHVLKEVMDIEVKAGKFMPDNLKQADEAWICNSVKEVAPVARLDDVPFGTASAFTEELQSQFKTYLQTQLTAAL